MELHERLSNVRPAEPAAPWDAFAEVKNRIHMSLIVDLGPQLFNAELDPAELRARVLDQIRAQLAAEAGIARDDRERLIGDIADDILGHGPLERLLADETVTEIMVNGPHDIWVERRGRLHDTPVKFIDESHLRRILNTLDDTPACDAVVDSALLNFHHFTRIIEQV